MERDRGPLSLSPAKVQQNPIGTMRPNDLPQLYYARGAVSLYCRGLPVSIRMSDRIHVLEAVRLALLRKGMRSQLASFRILSMYLSFFREALSLSLLLSLVHTHAFGEPVTRDYFDGRDHRVVTSRLFTVTDSELSRYESQAYATFNVRLQAGAIGYQNL